MSSPFNSLISFSLASSETLSSYRRNLQNASVTIDGHSLSIAALVATARYNHTPQLDNSPAIRQRIEDSVKCLGVRLARGESLYGINTGFGGSADSRTSNMHALQLALLQHQQAGILEVPRNFSAGAASLPHISLNVHETPLSQPEAWVRGAILVRLNSLVRGHSGVRWEVLERMHLLLVKNIVPVVPLRGSISASGDLSPLSYVASTLTGQKGVWAWVDGPDGARIKVPSDEALRMHGIPKTVYEPKEALGILNGTAFSAGVGALVMHDAVNLAMLTQVTTAMAVEATLATDASFAPFIHEIARPHPGQIESAATILALLEGSKLATHLADERHVHLSEDEGSLRQDRYQLRTAAQWMGPQIEDIVASAETIRIELNSTTDNPLVDAADDKIHHGGNFQAMSVTNAMEKTRLSLHHFGKLTFQQMAELVDPSKSRGLPANLAATDPSLNFHCKGIDIALAAAIGELGFLAGPVSTHVQCAELSNQSVFSLALVSARYTLTSIQVLSQLLAWSLYMLCQAFDLRAVQHKLANQLEKQIQNSIHEHFSTWISKRDQIELAKRVFVRLNKRLDETSARDLHARLSDAYMQAGFEIISYFSSLPSGGGADPLRTVMKWRDASADQTHTLYRKVTCEFLEDPKACHAAPLLGRTAPVYIYIRRTLGVPMHGRENMHEFKGEEGALNATIGGYVSCIYESIRNGDLYVVLADLFRNLNIDPGLVKNQHQNARL